MGLFLLIIIFMIATPTSTLTVGPGIIYIVGNETYGFNRTMEFNQIILNSNWIRFNDTDFNITSPNNIIITMDYLHHDIDNASEELVLKFYANAASGKVWFNISGFTNNIIYNVTRDNTVIATPTANSSHYISFNSSVWSEHEFEIYREVGSPTVTTNTSTDIEEYNATIHGYLLDTGGESCVVWFEYGTNTSYGTNTTKQILSSVGMFDISIPYNNSYEVTLLPDGVGDKTELDKSGASTNWECAKTNDGYTSYVYTYATGNHEDLYSLQNHTFFEQNGIINFVKIYVKARSGQLCNRYARTYLDKNGKDEVGGNYWPPATYWGSTSTTYTDDIETGSAWDWAGIDVLQGGVQLYKQCPTGPSIECTYVWLEVNYTENVSNLIPGQLYHYRTVANNSNGTTYGSDMAFLTKPTIPSGNVTSGYNPTCLNISWTKGTGANLTRLERNTSQNWDLGEGILLYNGSNNYYNDTGLIQNTIYYYRLWSFTNWTYNPTVFQWSNGSLLLTNTTAPLDPPYNGSSVYFVAINHLNLTWDRGNNSDMEIVVKNNNTWPSTPADGWVRQNSTNQWFNVSENESGYYTIWSYNVSGNCYSATGLNIPWGIVCLNCFNESNPGQAIGFDIEITDQGASQVYIATDCINTHEIDMMSIPYGDDTIFIVSNDSYRQRIYYYDLIPNNVYNFSFYLPPVEIPIPPGGGGEEECELRSYSDSITITNPDADATISLTYILEDIVDVQIFNKSLYGSYGGWLLVSSDKYSFDSSQVVINKSVLDDNTTIAKVDYYYMHCEGMLESILCQITVCNEYDQVVPNADCIVKHINNETEQYVVISKEITDGNGQFTIWLIPYSTYRFEITKEGYTQIGSKFWTPSPQEYSKIFRLNYNVSEQPAQVLPNDIITFNAYFNEGDNNTLYIEFIDSSGNTTDGLITIYQNGTDDVFNVSLINSSYNFIWNGGNHSLYEYKVRLCLYNHSNIGNWSTVRIIPSCSSMGQWGIGVDIDVDIVEILGENPAGWINCLIFFFAVFFLVTPGKAWVGIGIASIGAILFIFQLFMGLPVFSLAQLSIIPFFVLYGFLVQIAKSKKETRL